jgi:hypothetical protein
MVGRSAGRAFALVPRRILITSGNSDDDTHTQSRLMPVLSTTPIDHYFDGGIVRATPGIRRLVLLILVLGTHVGKLYSASTLVLF